MNFQLLNSSFITIINQIFFKIYFTNFSKLLKGIMNKKIGFIGLGIMGSRMANNLLKTGYHLFVYNRTEDKAKELINKGAEFIHSPRELASKSDVVITMLSTPQVVHDISDEIIRGLPKGKTWIDCSTINPETSLDMAEKCKAKEIKFIDAPVSGSKAAAEKAELVFLAGGIKADVEECAEIFNSMGKQTHYIGENGKGASLKLLLNMMLGVNMAAFSEAIKLGRKLNLNEDLLLNILTESPVTAPLMALKKIKIKTNNYETDFPLQWMLKDLTLISNIAKHTNTQTLTLDGAKELFELANSKGLSEEDYSAVNKIIE